VGVNIHETRCLLSLLFICLADLINHPITFQLPYAGMRSVSQIICNIRPPCLYLLHRAWSNFTVLLKPANVLS